MSDDDETYVLVEGNDIAPDGLSEQDLILQCLLWIGFTVEGQRELIVDECMGEFDDLLILQSEDIDAMAKDYGTRTAGSGKISFGMRRVKLLKALVHWMQDFQRVSCSPTLKGLNANTFRDALNTAITRADVRSNLKKQTSTAADAATPGPLESERKWKQGEEKFINYARAHIGAGGVPLSYVIWEKDEPDIDGTFNDFVSKTIACAPLSGEYYNADRLSVFNMIVSFTTGQPAGDWVKHTLRYSDGCRSMKALCDHFGGAGNATRNKAEADRLQESLHYKSERSMAFETFLTQCQKMYNIYDKEDEAMTEDQKVRFLFKKVQHTGLQPAIEALRARQATGAKITYDDVANHLSTKVSELPEYLSRNRTIAGVRFKSQSNNKGIYDENGKILTHIPHWNTLTIEEKNKVIAEQKKKGTSGGGKGKWNSSPSKASTANTMKQLKTQNQKYKRKIKALQRGDDGDGANDNAKHNESDSDVDAGDQFGGRHNKQSKKNKV